jgi:hypothetical protein
MLTSQVFKSRSGLHYSLRHSTKCLGSRPNGIKAESFTNEFAALQFVRNLQVPLFFWQNLAQENSFYSYTNWKNINPWGGIENYIALTLVQGRVQAYQTIRPEHLAETTFGRSFTQDGKNYEITHVHATLNTISNEALSFNNMNEANKFMGRLERDAAQLTFLAKTLQLPISKSSSATPKDLRLAIGEAISNGEVVIIEKPEQKVSTQDTVEEVIDAKSNNVANDAPPAPANSDNKKDDKQVEAKEDLTCDFYNLRLHCQHKASGARKFELDVINKEPNHNGSQYGLQVIAPPKTPDYISVLFNGVCRKGKETCGGIEVSGPNTSKTVTGNRYSFSASAKKLKGSSDSSFINFLSTNLVPSLTDGLQYETYTVESQSCTPGNSHKAIIQAFPSFKWAGEISIGYKSDKEKARDAKAEWLTKGKIGGNIGERTLSYDTETKKEAKNYFPSLQGTLGDMLSQIDKFSSAKGALNSLGKLSVESAISIGGGLELKESNKSYAVGLGGEISINLNPLFGATVSVDIFDYLTMQAGGPILLEYKKMAEKGESHAVVIKAVISVKGDVTANLKWEKGVDDQWLSTEGDKSGQAALGVTIGLAAEISVKTKIIFTEICVAVGARASLQGARSNAEGIGVIAALTATTAEGKPAVDGSIAFTGATLYYSYYAEVGVSEAKSKKMANQTGRKTSKKPKPESSSKKITAGKESKIEIFKYSEWPKSNENSDPITLDNVTF